MRARSATYSARSGRARWWLAKLTRYVPFPRLRLPVRVLAWVLAAGLAAIAGWQYALLGPVVFEIALVLLAIRDERRVRQLPSAVAHPADDPQAQAALAEARRLAALPRVASPGGWVVPLGRRAAWNWVPPPGIEPRLDRVPLWARLWFATPLLDRYAHQWLWHHGGWDVIPASIWPGQPS